MRSTIRVALFLAIVAVTSDLSIARQRPPYPAAVANVSAYPNAVTFARDFDRDGRIDHLSVPGLTTTFGDGFGNFGESVTTSLLCAPPCTVGDIDGDGILDLVVKMGAQTRLLRGDGFGKFAIHAKNLPPPFPAAIAAADADDDGDVDIVSVGAHVYGFRVLANGSPWKVIHSSVPLVPERLAVADVDANGHVDAIVTEPSLHRVTIAFGTGTGTFANPVTIALGSAFTESRDLEVADIDGDTLLDVLVLDAQGTVHGALYGGGGTFAAPFTIVTDAESIAVADGDADGDADIVLGGSAHLLRNDGGASFTSVVATNGWIPEHLVFVGLVDGDPWTDVIARHASDQSGSLTLLGSGPLTFESGVVSDFEANPGSPAIADLDGDGDLDVVRVHAPYTPQATFRFALNDGTGKFTAQSGPPASFGIPSAGDFDGDGIVDLATRSSEWSSSNTNQVDVFRGSGGGAFTAPLSRQFSGFEFGPLQVVDIDADGVDELAYLVRHAARMEFVHVSAGTLSLMQTLPLGWIVLGARIARFGDLDGDGLPELASVDPFVDDTIQFHANVAGTLVPTGSSVVVSYYYVRDVELGDLDGDGLADLVHSQFVVGSPPLFAELWSRRSLGAGTFDAPVVSPPLFGFGAFELVDLDGDARPEAMSLPYVSTRVARSVGFGQFEPPSPAILTYADGKVADLDGDGRPELVAGNSTRLTVLRMECVGSAGRFGHACAGAGGFAPSLTLEGCVRPGAAVTIDVRNAPGGSIALLIAGTGAAPSASGSSCLLQVASPVGVVLALPLAGTGPGGGHATITAHVPSTIAHASHVMLQAVVADASLAQGFSVTQGLDVYVE
jgi:hypothetical protein